MSKDFTPERLPSGTQGPVKIVNTNILDSKPLPAQVDFHMGSESINLYCAQCRVEIRKKPSAPPFKTGPFRGGYLCMDCVVLSYAASPESISDSSARRSIVEEAKKIQMRRAQGQGKGELLFDDPEGKAWLVASQGTILLDLKKLPFGAEMEFDPGRFKLLMKAFKAISSKIQGYEINEDWNMEPEFEVWIALKQNPLIPIRVVLGSDGQTTTKIQKEAEGKARELLGRTDIAKVFVIKKDVFVELTP